MRLTRLERRLARRAFRIALPGGVHPAVPRGPADGDVDEFLDAFFGHAPWGPGMALRVVLAVAGVWPALLLGWWFRSRFYLLKELGVLVKALALLALGTDPDAEQELRADRSARAPVPAGEGRVRT